MTSVKGKTIGLMVDRVSDILTVSMGTLQPVPAATGFVATGFAEGIFARDREMICFLKLTALFATTDAQDWEDAA